MIYPSIKPWQVSEQDFPIQGSATQQLQFLLNYAVLAPSGHNTQPWKFTLQNETLELWADSARALPLVDPNHRELTISCGAALFNLRLALHHFGYCGDIQTLPDPAQPDLLARIRLGDWGSESAEEKSLFEAIPQRHTNRQTFEDWDIPETVLQWLSAIATEEGAWLYLVQDEAQKAQLFELVKVADQVQMADPDIRKELSTWMHSGNDPSCDGLPGYAMGIPPRFDFLTRILAWLTRSFNLGNEIARQDEKRLQCASAIIVLGTDDDTPEDWLNAGQALEKMLLRAQSLGIVASFFNAPIQMPEIRPQLQQCLNREGYPQVLLRLGYSMTAQPTPRRSSDDVLL